jgi:hypothetical protein
MVESKFSSWNSCIKLESDLGNDPEQLTVPLKIIRNPLALSLRRDQKRRCIWIL